VNVIFLHWAQWCDNVVSVTGDYPVSA